jgi:hypothetical protein
MTHTITIDGDMKLYHTTTAKTADRIMVDGFRDHATVNRRLSATYRYPPGVWFGDVPALDDDLFDGIGMFDFDAEKQAFIAITIPVIYRWPDPDVRLVKDATWPGTQYWAKADIWNQFPKTRLSLDEVIELRLFKCPTWIGERTNDHERVRSVVEKWARERDYGKEFAARVMKVLEKCARQE